MTTRQLQTMTVPQLRAKFDALAEEWWAECKHISSVTESSMHIAYQQIIGMGPAVLPILFQSMNENNGPWFWALRAITCDDPVPEEDRGRIGVMAEHWRRWAIKKGYL